MHAQEPPSQRPPATGRPDRAATPPTLAGPQEAGAQRAVAPAHGGLLARQLQAALLARGRSRERERTPPPRERRPHVSFKQRLTRTAERIADGHAFRKHRHEFRTIRTWHQFVDRIVDVMETAAIVRQLRGGRTAYYDEDSNTLVLQDPSARDGGTMFKPSAGYEYVRRLR